MATKREKIFSVWFLGSCLNMYELSAKDHSMTTEGEWERK